MAAQHLHMVSFIFTGLLPALLAICVVNPHSSTLFQFTIWAVVTNLEDQAGYEFPWSPVRWFPFSETDDDAEFWYQSSSTPLAAPTTIDKSTLIDGNEEFLLLSK